MKQEKHMKQYQEELKLKQMKNSDSPSLCVERLREAQAQLKTPYLILSGNVKPGQTSDPRSGFGTIEKDVPGSLTLMLGDRKLEHFLGIKRKGKSSNMGPPKKPKTRHKQTLHCQSRQKRSPVGRLALCPQQLQRGWVEGRAH